MLNRRPWQPNLMKLHCERRIEEGVFILMFRSQRTNLEHLLLFSPSMCFWRIGWHNWYSRYIFYWFRLCSEYAIMSPIPNPIIVWTLLTGPHLFSSVKTGNWDCLSKKQQFTCNCYIGSALPYILLPTMLHSVSSLSTWFL